MKPVMPPGVYELFTRPSPPPAGEREALINELKSTNLYYQHGKAIGLAKRAADMLAADHIEGALNMLPMTKEQISDAYKKATGQHLRPCDKHAVESMTREIEAHHEIGVKP